MPPKKSGKMSARLLHQQARREEIIEAPSVNAADAASVTPSSADSQPPLLAPPLRNTITEESLPTPQPPPLLDTTHVASSSTATGDAPSIRCTDPGDGAVKKKRRMIVSNKTASLVKSNGKIKPVWDGVLHNGPALEEHYSLLVRDIGVAIRSHVRMCASTFYELPIIEKDVVKSYLQMYYDIPITELQMWNWIDEKSQTSYKTWKSKCRQIWVGLKDKAVVPLEFLHRPDQWQYLVENEFLDEKKTAISLRNKANRTKNKNAMNHHSGAKPLSRRAEKYLKDGHVAPHAAAAVDVYLPSTNGSEKADKLNQKLIEMTKAREEADPKDKQPVSFEDQCGLLDNYFGERKGTGIRGMGKAGKRPEKRRGGHQAILTQEAEDIIRESQVRAREAEANYQLERLSTARAEENNKKFMEENQELKDRMRAMELQLQQLLNQRQ